MSLYPKPRPEFSGLILGNSGKNVIFVTTGLNLSTTGNPSSIQKLVPGCQKADYRQLLIRFSVNGQKTETVFTACG